MRLCSFSRHPRRRRYQRWCAGGAPAEESFRFKSSGQCSGLQVTRARSRARAVQTLQSTSNGCSRAMAFSLYMKKSSSSIRKLLRSPGRGAKTYTRTGYIPPLRPTHRRANLRHRRLVAIARSPLPRGPFGRPPQSGRPAAFQALGPYLAWPCRRHVAGGGSHSPHHESGR